VFFVAASVVVPAAYLPGTSAGTAALITGMIQVCVAAQRLPPIA
jgi:hypothetical protein